jgi:hypothetical protein
VLMEDVFQLTGPPGLLLEEHRGGKYVHTTCLRSVLTLDTQMQAVTKIFSS